MIEKMIKNVLFLLYTLVSITVSAQEASKGIDQFVNEIDKKIPKLLHDFIVPGTAIAIIENGEIVLQKGYGYSNIDKGIKVSNTTGFNIGSISKTVAAWGVMKLVQEGKLDLDAPAKKYLTRWQLPESDYDENGVTIRRLLSHTAGLSLHGYPGWSPKDELPTIEESLNGKNNGPGRVEIIMEPGTRYKYSGGGFTMLQLIIEEITGKKFEAYMQEEVLAPLGMINSSYSIDEKILKASSLEYNNFGEKIDFELFTAQAAAGLHTTIDDFTKFALASMYKRKQKTKNQSILSADILAEMMEPAPSTDGRYGLGYQVDSIAGASMTLRGHGGANTGWHAYLRVDPDKNDGFIVVTNGGAGHNIYRQLFCDWIYWKTQKSLGRRCEVRISIANKMKQIIDEEGNENLGVHYAEVKKNDRDQYDFSESQLNELGYHYLSKENIENAMAIFKLNVDLFPYSFNVYDSYGEALLKKGDKEKAIENYLKSIEIFPGNEHGINVLNGLGISTDHLTKAVHVEDNILQSYVGRYEISPGFILTVSKDGGQLITQATGQNEFKIYPKSKNEFFLKAFEAQLAFNVNENEQVESVTMLQQGNETLARKLKEGTDTEEELVDLLETDSTWSKEIFHFPISFAPEINYEGFEEARFPPGWGKKESNEFWSYAFAWHINLGEELTEKELQENLQIYFDGLMKVVNKDKELEIPKTIAVIHKKEENNNSPHFVGTVRIYDAFKTKKNITLNVTVEKYNCKQNKKSIILFRFSPKDLGDEIWLKLEQVKLLPNVCN